MMKASRIASALICATMLAIGFGVVVPVSSAVGDGFDVLAVASGVLFCRAARRRVKGQRHEFRLRAIGPAGRTANLTQPRPRTLLARSSVNFQQAHRVS